MIKAKELTTNIPDVIMNEIVALLKSIPEKRIAAMHNETKQRIKIYRSL